MHRGGNDVEQLDTGVYLTERLRAAQPEYFDQELQRSTRKARLVGFVFGGLVTAVLGVVGVVSFLVFAPGFAEAVLAGLL